MVKTIEQKGQITYQELLALKENYDITYLFIGLMPDCVLSIVRVEYRKKKPSLL